MSTALPVPSRREILAGAGFAAMAAATADAATAPAVAEFATNEYWAMKGNVRLYMYRKRLAAPAQRPVLFLVHGSSVSSRPSFDLATPGLGEYSLMNVFARAGFDVWTLDFEGYGRSTVTAGNSDIRSGVADLAAAMPVVMRETGQQRVHLYGDSSGALRAGAFAVAHPDRVNRLVLAAFTFTGRGSPTLTDRARQVDFYRSNSRRPRDLAMVRSIFTRDKPGTTDMRLADLLAAAELPHGETVPTGTYLDMTANLPVVDPKQLRAPVLVLRGEYDGIATEEDLMDFFRQLPNGDRQFAVLPGIAHSLQFQINRALVWHAATSFLKTPQAQAV
jgi:pimeloyl-ACP methyl ester carboxylesterase